MQKPASPEPPFSPSPSSPSPPSSPPFHGFSDDTIFPQQLVLVTEGEGDEEQLVDVFKKHKVGRPSQGWEKDKYINKENISESSRRPPSESVISTSKASSSKTFPAVESATSSRPKPYLLEKLEPSIRFAKLSKTRTALSVFLFHLEIEKLDPPKAAQETLNNVKEIWVYHFGTRVINGFDDNLKEEAKKMIISDDNGRRKLISLWKSWKELERISRRPDRAMKNSFKKRQEEFVSNVLQGMTLLS